GALPAAEGTGGPGAERPPRRRLFDERRQEARGEPFAADGDGAAEGDSVEVLVEPLCFDRLRAANEAGRPGWDDPRDSLDECACRVQVGGEELDFSVAVTAGDDAQRQDLRVWDMDQLAFDRADRERAQRDLLDDPLSVPEVDPDRVRDAEPALEEHQQPRDDVHQEALNGKADDQREK